MVGDRTNRPAEIGAVETVVGAAGDLLIEVSTNHTAKGIFVIGDAFGPFIAAGVCQACEPFALELGREVVVVRVAAVVASVDAVPVGERPGRAREIGKPDGVGLDLIQIGSGCEKQQSDNPNT